MFLLPLDSICLCFARLIPVERCRNRRITTCDDGEVGFQVLKLPEGLLTVTVYNLGIMEDLDVVDYSSDRLESSDI